MKTEMNDLFRIFQFPLVKFANSGMGRRYLGIFHECKEKILGVTPNSYVYEQNGHLCQTFRTYPLFRKKIGTLLKTGACVLFPYQAIYAPFFIGETSSIYSNSGGDGMINAEGKATWPLARDATDGDAVSNNATVYLESSKTGSNTYTVHRVFLDFDTSTLPAGAQITAATLYIYNNNDTTNVDSTDIVLTSNAQADPESLAVADFDQLGGASIGATRPTIAGIGANAYFTIAIAEGSLSQVNKTGYTKLGLRVGGDLDNSAPTGNNYVLISMTEQAGTNQDPYITVTYSTGGSFLFNFI